MSSVPTDQDIDTSRTAVKTYVPAYQKEQWKEHADELDMTQSEFVRTMVQAGRRGFEPSEDDPASSMPSEGPDRPSDSNPAEADDDGATPGVGLEERVVDLLEREGCLAWDELVEELTDDIERRLDDAMQELQDENRVRYSGREGGYTLS